MATVEEFEIIFICSLFIGTLLGAESTTDSDPLVTCGISSTTSDPSLDFEVCVLVRGPTSLEVTWSPQESIEVEGHGKVEQWQLSVTNNEDDRYVSFNSLAPSVSRFVVTSLLPNTSYNVYLVGLNETDHDITRLNNRISVRTTDRGAESIENDVDIVSNSGKKGESKYGEGKAEATTRSITHVASSAESKKAGRHGKRLLWWVSVSTGTGLGLILVLSGVTICHHRYSKRSAQCPHIERKLSSSKANDAATTSTNRTATLSRNEGQGLNDYVSTPQRRLPAAPPPEITITTATDGNNIKNGSNRLHVSSEDNRESGAYALIRDISTRDPDPRSSGRMISMISWGSEFDILDERAMKAGNNTTCYTGSEVYNNTVYGNLQTTSVESPPPRPPRPAPKTKRPSASNLPPYPDPSPYLVPVKQSLL